MQKIKTGKNLDLNEQKGSFVTALRKLIFDSQVLGNFTKINSHEIFKLRQIREN